MNKKIIFVDDEEGILELYQDIFDTTDYQVFTSSNPRQALKTIQEEKIQVMFFDLRMPDMDGIELCREIRDKNNIAIIHAVTGYSSLFELADIREAGFDEYFSKPIHPSELISSAQEAFEKLERWTKN